MLNKELFIALFQKPLKVLDPSLRKLGSFFLPFLSTQKEKKRHTRSSISDKEDFMNYPLCLEKLIQALKKFPGIGSKSAERLAFHMLDWPQEQFELVIEAMQTAKHSLQGCSECGSLCQEQNCLFCKDKNRSQESICVVAYPREVFAIEETRKFNGLYHVLGGTLSPLEGRYPKDMGLEKLKKRLETLKCREIIAALDSTLEGDATVLYLQETLKDYPIKITRLAFGIPLGSALEYVDGGTLAKALCSRLTL